MFKNEFPFRTNTFQIIGFTFSIEKKILIRFGSEIVLCSKKRSKTLMNRREEFVAQTVLSSVLRSVWREVEYRQETLQQWRYGRYEWRYATRKNGLVCLKNKHGVTVICLYDCDNNNFFKFTQIPSFCVSLI